MMLTTAQEETTSAASPEVGTARVEAFSDSVMAVIITIMAFELRPPQGFTLEAMRDQLPAVLVYVLSFVFIGIYWNNHHHLLRAADRISGAAMWANLFLLFWLSLIPVLRNGCATSISMRFRPQPMEWWRSRQDLLTRSSCERSSRPTAATREWPGPSGPTRRVTCRLCSTARPWCSPLSIRGSRTRSTCQWR